jgi:hypothetical protein
VPGSCTWYKADGAVTWTRNGPSCEIDWAALDKLTQDESTVPPPSLFEQSFKYQWRTIYLKDPGGSLRGPTEEEEDYDKD